MGFSRSGKSIESRHLQHEVTDRRNESRKLTELGEKFEKDKERIEDKIASVENSSIKREDKVKILNALKNSIEKLKEQYEKDVDSKNEKIIEEFKEKKETAQEHMEELQETIDSIESVNMEAAEFDSQEAIDAAREKKDEFARIKEESAEALRQKIAIMEEQRRNIQRKKFSS